MNEREANRIKDIIYEAMTNDRSSYPCDYDEEHESFDAPMDEDVCARCKYRRVCQVLNDYKRDDGFEEAMLSLIEDDEPENAEPELVIPKKGWVTPKKDYPKLKVEIIVELDSARDRIKDLCYNNHLIWQTHEIQQALSMINDSITGLQMWDGRIVAEPWSDKTPMHYRLNPEPIKCIEGWDLGYNKGNAIKYIARAGRKENESEAAALRKAIHSLEMRLEEIGESE